MTKKEIIKKLTDLGIEHDPELTGKELEALLPVEDAAPVAPTIEELLGEAEEGESEAKTKYRSHLYAYAKQNPKKFAVKQNALVAKLNTL